MKKKIQICTSVVTLRNCNNEELLADEIIVRIKGNGILYGSEKLIL